LPQYNDNCERGTETLFAFLQESQVSFASSCHGNRCWSSESEKGNISLFRGNNESGYLLVIYHKEPEDENDSDISTNTVGIP